MSRWIDAEKELKELKDMKVKGEVFTTAVNFAIRVIEEAPSIDVPRWIPCSERLPENIRPVLVTWKNNDPASY